MTQLHQPAGSGFSEHSVRQAFNKVLDLHRKCAPVEEVLRLEDLSFPLVETSDPAGLRFLLWQPVFLFLQHGFKVEVIERMCHVQVVLAYLEHDAATFTKRIIQPIEVERSKTSFGMVSLGPQILIQVLTFGARQKLPCSA